MCHRCETGPFTVWLGVILGTTNQLSEVTITLGPRRRLCEDCSLIVIMCGIDRLKCLANTLCVHLFRTRRGYIPKYLLKYVGTLPRCAARNETGLTRTRCFKTLAQNGSICENYPSSRSLVFYFDQVSMRLTLINQ